MIASVEKGWYYVRWRTTTKNGELEIEGWDVIDDRRFDNKTVVTYPDRETAQAVANLLNSQEKIERS